MYTDLSVGRSSRFGGGNSEAVHVREANSPLFPICRTQSTHAIRITSQLRTELQN